MTRSSAYWLMLGVFVVALGASAYAVGDAGTKFQVFVPPNNDAVNRDSALIVTNVSPRPSVVQIEDTDEDGDMDDSYYDVVLETGQSQVVYIKDSAFDAEDLESLRTPRSRGHASGGAKMIVIEPVDDDAKGKRDGDYFRIESTEPVVVQIATRSDWQWDFAPADNRSMRGQSFFIYSAGTSYSDRDLNVFSYEPETRVSLFRISQEATDKTGLTVVDIDQAEEVLNATLQAGEDLMTIYGLGEDVLDPGHTYWVRASQPVTVMYGALNMNARDGMAFVPSRNGSASGEEFYFTIPSDYTGEKELRLIAYDDGTEVSFEGWDRSSRSWIQVQEFELDGFQHGDWIQEREPYELFRLVSNEGHPVSVLIQDWMESRGLSGTKDDTSFGSARSGYGAGMKFLMYLPPPGSQIRVAGFGGEETHVFLYGHVEGTEWRVRDADTNGSWLDERGVLGKGEFARVSVDSTLYQNMYKPQKGERPYVIVEANHLITAQVSNFNDNWMTYVPSVMLPNPDLMVFAANEHVSIGEPERLTFRMHNVGASSLGDANIRVFLDPAAVFASARVEGVEIGEPEVTVDEETGNQIVEWDGLSIPADEAWVVDIGYSVNARRRDGSKVRNGELLNHTVQARGKGYGVPVAEGGEYEQFTAQSSVAVTVQDNSLTLVNGPSAQVVGETIVVRWTTVTEPDAAGFRVLRSTSADGKYTRVTGGDVSPKGDALHGASYEVPDSDARSGRTYYYRLDLIDFDGNTRSIGPVMATLEDRTPPAAPVLQSSEGLTDRVDLVVSGGEEVDFAGFEIFRAESEGGSYTRVLGPTERFEFADEDIENGTTYYYKARSVDTVGNVSLFSNILSATPPVTSREKWVVAYEDMLGPSANDWDYNDFVVRIDALEQYSKGGVESVTARIEALARGAAFHNAFRLRVRGSGGWTSTVRVFSNRDSESPLEERTASGSGDADVLVWANTRDALPEVLPDSPLTNTERDQTIAILGQTVDVIITFENPQSNPTSKRHAAPYDPYLQGGLGEIHLVRENSPQSVEVVRFYPNSPLFGYHLDYALAFPAENWQWPAGGERVWEAYPESFASYIFSGKNSSIDWYLAESRDRDRTWNHYPFDAEKDRRWELNIKTDPDATAMEKVHALEQAVAAPLHLSNETPGSIANGLVVSGATTAFFLAMGTEPLSLSVSSPRMTPVRFDSNGEQFMLAATEEYDGNSVLSLRNADTGAVVWSHDVTGSIKSCPVVYEQQDSIRVAYTTDAGRLGVIDANGNVAAGEIMLGEQGILPKNLLRVSAPRVGDFDSDDALDIVAASSSGELRFLDGDTLTPKSGWPVSADAPITADLMVTHHPEDDRAVIMAGDHEGLIHAWDATGESVSGFPLELGRSIVASPARFEDWTGHDWVVWASSAGTVALVDGAGNVREGWPVDLEEPVSASPIAGDLDGDAQHEIVVATESGLIFVLEQDGSTNREYYLSVGEAVTATPVLADFDLDARLELWVASAQGNLYMRESTLPSALSPYLLAAWPMQGHSPLAPLDEVFSPVRSAANASVNAWLIY